MPSFDPYHKWFGISLAEQPPSLYRLLGVSPFESDPDVINAAIEQRFSFLRQQTTGSQFADARRLLDEVAAAGWCLLNAEAKRKYDQSLRDSLPPNPIAPNPNNMTRSSASQFHIPPPPPPVASKRSVARPAQIPAGCEWLWSETEGVPGQLALLTTALINLDDGSTTALLTSFLETQLASDKVRAVCEALAQASETHETKRRLLVEFVDHPQLPAATLLNALRSSSAIRRLVFEHYATYRQDQPLRDFRLPGLLESSVEKLTDPRESSWLLDLLKDSRPVLTKATAAQVNGWLIIRKQFEELKKLAAEAPSLWDRALGGRHAAKIQEHGLKLAEESRTAMPDARYAMDHKAQERCEILRRIGEPLLKPRVLPDAFWKKLSSAMSGNGWKILESRPASLHRPPAVKPLSPQIKTPSIPVEIPKPALPPTPVIAPPPIVVIKPPDPVPPSTPVLPKPSTIVWMAEFKRLHIDAAIALSIVVALSFGGWLFFQKEFGPTVLAQLTSLPKEQQVEAFLNLPDEQFTSLMADPELFSKDSVAFSINDRLTSFEKLSEQRSEKWRFVVWPKLTPDKQVDLLLKLPPAELARQLDSLTRNGQETLMELFNFPETSPSRLTALAQQLDKQQLRQLLSNPQVKRRVEVLVGFKGTELLDLDLSVMQSLTPHELAELVLELPTETLRGLLQKLPEERIEKLLENRTKKGLTEKLKKASPSLVARLLAKAPATQTASNPNSPPMPKPPPVVEVPKPTAPTPMPMPVVEVKKPIVKDPPKVKPVVEDSNPKALRFEGEAPEPRIAYRALPKYPRSADDDRDQPVTDWELPKEAESFTKIRLRGFEEHQKWCREKNRKIPKTVEEENGKKLRVVLSAETPPKTLCSFELRAPNLLVFDWEFQPDALPQLPNAVRSCVLEIQRGEQPAVFVSFLPHKLLEEPLYLGIDSVCSLTSSLKDFHLGGSLQLAEGAIHITAKPGRNAGTFPFQPSAPPTNPPGRFEIPELCKPFEIGPTKFEFSTAVVQLETERTVNGIKEFSIDEQTETKLVLYFFRKLSAEVQREVDTLKEQLDVLTKKPPTLKNKGLSKEVKHSTFKEVLAVLGLEEPKDKPPNSKPYDVWAAEVITKDLPAKIKELKAKQTLVTDRPKKDREQFLNLSPVVSGTVVRVVDGIVVKALELRPMGIVESSEAASQTDKQRER